MTKYKKLSEAKVDFPIFKERPELVYLDSTATSLKPESVLVKLNQYYRNYSANVFRGLYPISEMATEAYEKARAIVADFVGCKDAAEIIFVRNATEALNLVAYSLGPTLLDQESEIITTIAEHHANFVPYQRLAQENGAVLKVLEVDERGLTKLDDPQFVRSVVNPKTKLLAINYVSNVLGTIQPLKEIIRLVREVNPKITVVVDAAQAVPCLKIDVNDLDCDFLAFSGHKVLGPTGIGVLWGKRKILEEMPPFLFGGEMIREVTIENTTFADLPNKFEAGTPHIAGAIGLGEAIRYLEGYSRVEILKHEQKLFNLLYHELRKNPQIEFLTGEPNTQRVGILSFNHKRIHAHDLSQILAEDNICVRAGHHCAMPLHTAAAMTASCRVSFYLYNTTDDLDRFLASLRRAEKLFGD